MTRIERYFEGYAAYHRDPRNEATHLVGIPLIVLAAIMWTARVTLFDLAGLRVDLAAVLLAVLAAFYLSLSLPLGAVAAVALAALYALGVVALGANPWVALALFVVGWALQFVGHHYEGKRPAFFTNASHLLVGPLWILGVAIGWEGRRSAGEPRAR